MKSEDIINQYRLAIEFNAASTESNEFSVHDLLDTLATVGMKLVRLDKTDYDEDGISIVSKAYMYSVVENIESSHVNSNDQNRPSSGQDEDFDDYIEDDLDPNDFYDTPDFDEDTQI